MEQKLFNLKMKILKDKSINDDLKRELADEIFQIQQEAAINYTHSCRGEAEQLPCGNPDHDKRMKENGFCDWCRQDIYRK